ncbi:hypothetical protein F0L68_23570 [Solihabitans fulvus]|uniref:Uncharacterized protein n=1 Tax=Solihabitans fulvus TaxID=1892852 RepID=A0A5B2X6D3_9PSEU|nr:hypothetical protein [Solihabitans fulvus]KAA2258804.1 hypothetical protein F0L68_23570 [Solihabitans fulvus]
MSTRPPRDIAVGQAVVGVLMLGCATLGHFPGPVPLLFVVAAVGTANAAFPLMRTFGSALLGGVAAASIALSSVPFVTCSSDKFTDVFPCTPGAPTWHLTGTVVVAGLAGASLVLARIGSRPTDRSR